MFRAKAAAFVTVTLLAACARAPIKSVDQAMRVASAPKVADDLQLLDLQSAIEKTVSHLEAHPRDMWFGNRVVTSSEYTTALKELAEALKLDPTGSLYFKTLDQKFEYREVYGDTKWGEVFITGYFEPIIDGRRKRTKKYNTPIYPFPKDLIRVNLEAYKDIGPGWSRMVTKFRDNIQRDGMLRGRLTKNDNGENVIVPYHSRREIDSLKALKKNRPLAWVDPIDAFFLHIQGSGTIQFSKKSEIRVGYVEQNGHPYVPIGRYLKDVIPIEEMSSHRIEHHLRQMTPLQAQELMEQNPSYIFFRKLDSAPVTAMGVEAVPGRSIATDAKYFPKGALAFLEFDKPDFESENDMKPKAWTKTGRFVLDHDTGGAIRGPHRVDLFWGKGNQAKQASGVMRQSGRLYYLVPKLLNEGVLR